MEERRSEDAYRMYERSRGLTFSIYQGGNNMDKKFFFNMEQTGLNIWKLRTDSNCTVQDLAEKLDVSEQAIYKYQSGKALPDMVHIYMMSELFKTSVENILVKRERSERSNERDDLSSFIREKIFNIQPVVNFQVIRCNVI